MDEIYESSCRTLGEQLQIAAKRQDSENESAGFFNERNRHTSSWHQPKGCDESSSGMPTSLFALTGTPLWDYSTQVNELASLMGGTYATGLSSHWRNLERESCREIWRAVQEKCQDYLTAACCSNNMSGKEMEGIEFKQPVVQITEEEKTMYLKSQQGIPAEYQSLGTGPADFDARQGHGLSVIVRQNAQGARRGARQVVELSLP